MTIRKLKHEHPGIRIHLFATFTSRAAFKDSIVTDHFTVLLINNGAVCIEINNKKNHLFINEVIVIPKKAVCEILLMSNQLQICQLSFTSEFSFKNSIKWPHIGYFEFFISHDIRKIYIKKKEAESLVSLFKLLNSKVRISDRNLYKKEIILLTFNLLLYELARIYYRSAWNENIRNSGNEKIVIHFFKLLELNCRKQHSVKFYADALNVTGGHLNRTVKKLTELTAKQCIEQALILEAKILLQNSELNILHISEELKFANTAFFSTFFKRHTSLSPSEYRSRLNQH